LTCSQSQLESIVFYQIEIKNPYICPSPSVEFRNGSESLCRELLIIPLVTINWPISRRTNRSTGTYSNNNQPMTFLKLHRSRNNRLQPSSNGMEKTYHNDRRDSYHTPAGRAAVPGRRGTSWAGSANPSFRLSATLPITSLLRFQFSIAQETQRSFSCVVGSFGDASFSRAALRLSADGRSGS
jgi:hypothetical protein